MLDRISAQPVGKLVLVECFFERYFNFVVAAFLALALRSPSLVLGPGVGIKGEYYLFTSTSLFTTTFFIIITMMFSSSSLTFLFFEKRRGDY